MLPIPWENLKVKDDFFQDVKFYCLGNVHDKVEALLTSGGASKKAYLSPFVTHCIVGDEADENEIEQASSLYEIPALRQEWVVHSVQAGQFLSLQGFSLDPSKLFTNCTFSLSNLDKKDSSRLWALIQFHGGDVAWELRSDNTHLITAKAEGKKFLEASKRDCIKIVTPDWVVDSIKQKAKCQESLYHPRLLRLPGAAYQPRPRPKKPKPPPAVPPPPPPTTTQHLVTATKSSPKTAVENRLLLQQLQQRRSMTESPLTSKLQSTVISSRPPPTSVHHSPPAMKPNSAQSGPRPNLPPPNTSQPTSMPNAPPSGPRPPIGVVHVGQKQTQQIQLPQTPVSVTPQMLAEQKTTVTAGHQQKQFVAQGPPISASQNLPPQQVMAMADQRQDSMGIQRPPGPQQAAMQHGGQQHPQGPQVPVSSQQQQWQQQQQQQQQPNQMQQMPQQPNQQQPPVSSQAGQVPGQHPQQWNLQQQQFARPQMMQAGQRPPGWQQQQQQPGQPMIQQPDQRPRQPTQHMLRQQQLIQQHLAALSPEQRNAFNQMVPREKQQYLAEKGLLLPNPQGQMIQRHTITLTDQQRNMLQNMDQQQRAMYIQKLQREKEIQIRQQMIQQRLQQQQQQQTSVQQVPVQQQPGQQQQPQVQQVMVSQQQPGLMVSQAPPGVMASQGGQMVSQAGQMVSQAGQRPQNVVPQQMMSPQQQQQMQWQQQQQQQQNPQQYLQQSNMPNVMPQQIRGPHTSPQPPHAMVGGNVSPNRMPGPAMSPQSQQQQIRPAWSGETHPALAQVPRTPQQLQHLQRLQLQREQQQVEHQMVGQRPPVPMQQQQQQMMGPQQPGMVGQPGMVAQQSGMPQQPGMPMQQQQFMPPGGQQMVRTPVGPQGGNTTKVALVNMLSNRLQQPPGPGMPPQPMAPTPPAQQVPPQMPPQSLPVQHPAMSMAPDGSAANRLQMMNQQLHHHQTPQPSHIMPPPSPAGIPFQNQNPQQQQFMMGQPRRPMDGLSNGQPPQGMPHPGVRFGPRMAMPPRPPVVAGPPVPRPQFHGHDPNTRLPPDLCLLGCIFFITDYPDCPEESSYCSDWKKVIRQYGGEVEDTYRPRITHLLCKNQDSAISQQALREAKRLVTAYWLNDIVVRKKVCPPWKAVHFPLPANFGKPCENMILTMTGFSGRDRDWIKDIIRMTGAKFTGFFTKHNHAIICKIPSGEKFEKAKEWKVPTVSVQWLNDILFSNVNAVQCMNNPKYQNWKLEDPFRIDYTLVPHLMAAWKNPIRVTPETYQKFKANPPARIKRKAERQRLEKEQMEAKRLRGETEGTMNMMPDLPPGAAPLPTPPPSVDPMTGEHPPMTGEHPPMTGDHHPNANGGGNGENGHPPVEGDEMPNGSVEKEEEEDEDRTRVLFSGFNSSELKELEEAVKELGGEVASQAKKATHLVMPKLMRTVTFLCGISNVKHVVKAEWIRESQKDKKFVDETKFYHTPDEEFEKMFHFSLTKILAKPDRNKLFEGKTFYLTPSIVPGLKDVRRIIESAGGQVDNRRRKDIKQIQQLNKEGRDPVYIIITCENDVHIVADVLKAKIGVYNTEFVLRAVTRGRMDFDLTQSIVTV